jgi:hypothetical protein
MNLGRGTLDSVAISKTTPGARRDRPVNTGADLSRPRELNSLTIVRALGEQPPATIVEPAAGSTVGRPVRRYRFRPTAGHVVHTARTTVAAEADPKKRLAARDRVLATCPRDAGVSTSDIWALTVGVTGPVDASGRTALFTSVRWYVKDLAFGTAGLSAPVAPVSG